MFYYASGACIVQITNVQYHCCRFGGGTVALINPPLLPGKNMKTTAINMPG